VLGPAGLRSPAGGREDLIRRVFLHVGAVGAGPPPSGWLGETPIRRRTPCYNAVAIDLQGALAIGMIPRAICLGVVAPAGHGVILPSFMVMGVIGAGSADRARAFAPAKKSADSKSWARFPLLSAPISPVLLMSQPHYAWCLRRTPT
jgi:hypothetical protein